MHPDLNVGSYLRRRSELAAVAQDQLTGQPLAPTQLLLVQAFCDTVLSFSLDRTDLSNTQPGLERWWSVLSKYLAPGAVFAIGSGTDPDDPGGHTYLRVRATIPEGSPRLGDYSARVATEGLVWWADGRRLPLEPASNLQRLLQLWLNDARPSPEA
jgi:hypothetical protein